MTSICCYVIYSFHFISEGFMRRPNYHPICAKKYFKVREAVFRDWNMESQSVHSYCCRFCSERQNQNLRLNQILILRSEHAFDFLHFAYVTMNTHTILKRSQLLLFSNISTKIVHFLPFRLAPLKLVIIRTRSHVHHAFRTPHCTNRTSSKTVPAQYASVSISYDHEFSACSMAAMQFAGDSTVTKKMSFIASIRNFLRGEYARAALIEKGAVKLSATKTQPETCRGFSCALRHNGKIRHKSALI